MTPICKVWLLKFKLEAFLGVFWHRQPPPRVMIESLFRFQQRLWILEAIQPIELSPTQHLPFNNKISLAWPGLLAPKCIHRVLLHQSPVPTSPPSSTENLDKLEKTPGPEIHFVSASSSGTVSLIHSITFYKRVVYTSSELLSTNAHSYCPFVW